MHPAGRHARHTSVAVLRTGPPGWCAPARYGERISRPSSRLLDAGISGVTSQNARPFEQSLWPQPP